jgi:hypothetical protein
VSRQLGCELYVMSWARWSGAFFECLPSTLNWCKLVIRSCAGLVRSRLFGRTAKYTRTNSQQCQNMKGCKVRVALRALLLRPKA